MAGGFANAVGGVLVIGCNDDGKAVGVVHASKLLGKENRK